MSGLLQAIASGSVAIPADRLLAYLGPRRWSGRTEFADARLVCAVPIATEEGSPVVAVVDARSPAGVHEAYQLILVERPSGQGDALTGDESTDVVDGLECAVGLGPLVPAILAGGELETPGGVLRFAAVGSGPGPEAVARPLHADQSNSSIVVGEDVVVKFFRRLVPGVNPELELLHHLREVGFGHCPELVGWFGLRSEGIESTLGIVQRFVPAARDGWAIAVESAASGSIEADFLRHAMQIGLLVADMHLALADAEADPALRPEDTGAEAMGILAASLDERIVDTFAGLPEEHESLAEHAQALRERVAAAAHLTGLGKQIRCHGDLHLGQVLLGPQGWLVVDFEGEPMAPVSERRRKRSPLRDLAGMLRSVEYAAAHVALHRGTAPDPGWVEAVRSAILGSYLGRMSGSGLLPTTSQGTDELIALFEIEKLVYELRYEIAHRPDWVDIPAAGIRALAEAAWS